MVSENPTWKTGGIGVIEWPPALKLPFGFPVKYWILEPHH